MFSVKLKRKEAKDFSMDAMQIQSLFYLSQFKNSVGEKMKTPKVMAKKLAFACT